MDGSTNITTLGTIATGVWNGTTIGTAYGGTGLTSIGSAEQVLKVNSGGTALEWGSVTSGVWTQSGNDVYYNSGNVGVGTSTPGVSFEVVGDISGTNIKGVWAGDTIASTKGSWVNGATTGDIYASASNTLAKLAAGTDGHVLSEFKYLMGG